ncbi:MAG: hypothetical protein SGBAC_008195 [Bacillariaceae sp.]
MTSFNVQYNAQMPCFQLGNVSSIHISGIPPKEDVDEEIVQGMTHLSFEELQREQEELHGVSAIVRKEKEELDTLLETFRCHCDHLKRGTVYEYAESVDKNYVCNKAFQLMFIRGNRYETKTAAEQAIRFFDMKMKLFGKDKLVKDITLNDLDDDDKASLMAVQAEGYFSKYLD